MTTKTTEEQWREEFRPIYEQLKQSKEMFGELSGMGLANKIYELIESSLFSQKEALMRKAIENSVINNRQLPRVDITRT